MGKFIVIEGIDGAGTTTMTHQVAGALRRSGLRVIETAEPTRANVGRLLRRVITKDEQISNNASALLFAADRIYHDETFITPHIASGAWVICDRYLLSSLVYQALDGCDRRWIYRINQYARRPDLTFVLRCDPETAVKRLESSRNRKDKYEYYDFMRRAACRYEEAEQLADWPTVDIDATQAREDVLKSVLEHIRKSLGASF